MSKRHEGGSKYNLIVYLLKNIYYTDKKKGGKKLKIEDLVLGGNGGTGYRGTEAIQSLPNALELDHYVFISHLSSYYHNLVPFFVLLKVGKY